MHGEHRRTHRHVDRSVRRRRERAACGPLGMALHLLGVADPVEEVLVHQPAQRRRRRMEGPGPRGEHEPVAALAHPHEELAVDAPHQVLVEHVARFQHRAPDGATGGRHAGVPEPVRSLAAPTAAMPGWENGASRFSIVCSSPSTASSSTKSTIGAVVRRAPRLRARPLGRGGRARRGRTGPPRGPRRRPGRRQGSRAHPVGVVTMGTPQASDSTATYPNPS